VCCRWKVVEETGLTSTQKALGKKWRREREEREGDEGVVDEWIPRNGEKWGGVREEGTFLD